MRPAVRSSCTHFAARLRRIHLLFVSHHARPQIAVLGIAIHVPSCRPLFASHPAADPRRNRQNADRIKQDRCFWFGLLVKHCRLLRELRLVEVSDGHEPKTEKWLHKIIACNADHLRRLVVREAVYPICEASSIVTRPVLSPVAMHALLQCPKLEMFHAAGNWQNEEGRVGLNDLFTKHLPNLRELTLVDVPIEETDRVRVLCKGELLAVPLRAHTRRAGWHLTSLALDKITMDVAKALCNTSLAEMESLELHFDIALDAALATVLGEALAAMPLLQGLSIRFWNTDLLPEVKVAELAQVKWSLPNCRQLRYLNHRYGLDNPPALFVPMCIAPNLVQLRASNVLDLRVLDALINTCKSSRQLQRVCVVESFLDPARMRRSLRIPGCARGFADALDHKLWPNLTDVSWMLGSDRECHVLRAMIERPLSTVTEIQLVQPNAAAVREVLLANPQLRFLDNQAPDGHALDPLPRAKTSSESAASTPTKPVVHLLEKLTLGAADDALFTALSFPSMKSVIFDGSPDSFHLSRIQLLYDACPNMFSIALCNSVVIDDWKADAKTQTKITQLQLTHLATAPTTDNWLDLLSAMPAVTRVEMIGRAENDFPNFQRLVEGIEAAKADDKKQLATKLRWLAFADREGKLNAAPCTEDLAKRLFMALPALKFVLGLRLHNEGDLERVEQWAASIGRTVKLTSRRTWVCEEAVIAIANMNDL